ncbi:MAG: Cof-type HAD-IIB family hydrolase [Terriglobia bacterium]
MPIRLVAIDLDGTLLDSGGEISHRNLTALRAAEEQGVQVAIVTGRRFHSAVRLVGELRPETVLITSNGSRISSAAGEVFYRRFLGREAARKVIEATPDFRGYAVVTFDVAGPGQLLMEENAAADGPAGWYLRNSREWLTLAPNLADAIRTDPVQVMFGGPPDVIAPVEGVLRASAAAGLCHLTWTKYLRRDLSILDVLHPDCSKGVALAWWARRCGIEPEDVLAIGDNQNDLEMLKFAGQPVLMSNHNYESVPDEWPVTLSNDEHGVAEALRKYVLN